MVAILAAAVDEGWRAGATALWAAGRRREAVWLRADHHAAAAVIRGAASGRPRDVIAAVRHCGAMAAQSVSHPMLAAPWRDAARLLAVAAGCDGRPGAPVHELAVHEQALRERCGTPAQLPVPLPVPVPAPPFDVAPALGDGRVAAGV